MQPKAESRTRPSRLHRPEDVHHLKGKFYACFVHRCRSFSHGCCSVNGCVEPQTVHGARNAKNSPYYVQVPRRVTHDTCLTHACFDDESHALNGVPQTEGPPAQDSRYRCERWLLVAHCTDLVRGRIESLENVWPYLSADHGGKEASRSNEEPRLVYAVSNEPTGARVVDAI